MLLVTVLQTELVMASYVDDRNSHLFREAVNVELFR